MSSGVSSLRFPIKGLIHRGFEDIEDDGVARMLAPAAVGAAGYAVDIAAGQLRADLPEGGPVHLALVVAVALVQPQPIKRAERIQGCIVTHIVIAEVQVEQAVHPLKRREIPYLVAENLKVFKLPEVLKRADVLDPVERQDEHLEIGQVFHKGDVRDRVVAQVKRLQPDAVAQKVKVSACVSL